MNETTNGSNSALPPMIDTHCHLDDHQFADDLDDVLRNSREAGVTRWILIGYDPDRWDDATELKNQHEGMFHTVGVHPSCADQWSDEVATRLIDVATKSGAVGIGESTGRVGAHGLCAARHRCGFKPAYRYSHAQRGIRNAGVATMSRSTTYTDFPLIRRYRSPDGLRH